VSPALTTNVDEIFVQLKDIHTRFENAQTYGVTLTVLTIATDNGVNSV